MIPPGHRQMERRTVVQILMGHRPHHAQLVRDLGDLGHVLAESNAGNGRRDRVEGTAYFSGRIGFWIPGIDLALLATHKDHQHRLGSTEPQGSPNVRWPRVGQLRQPDEVPSRRSQSISAQPRPPP